MILNKVGAIGWPIEHSISPAMHNAAFAALGMTDWLYDKMAIPPDVLRHSLNEIRRHGYIGINVTVPHKETVMPLVTPDARARAVGAVNAIDLRSNVGTNTDVSGFMDDLTAHDVNVQGARVILLGAGGAARAALYGLLDAGARVAVVNRTRDRAETMIRDLSRASAPETAQNTISVIGLDQLTIGLNGTAHANGTSSSEDRAFAADLAEAVAWADEIDTPTLIVNATSVGMTPLVDETPFADKITFPRRAVAYDMVYRPAQTRFLARAEHEAARPISGMGMLVRQGAAAFAWWTGVQPPIEVMMEAARAALAAKNI